MKIRQANKIAQRLLLPAKKYPAYKMSTMVRAGYRRQGVSKFKVYGNYNLFMEAIENMTKQSNWELALLYFLFC
jgi:hypothetical protein